MNCWFGQKKNPHYANQELSTRLSKYYSKYIVRLDSFDQGILMYGWKTQKLEVLPAWCVQTARPQQIVSSTSCVVVVWCHYAL